MRSITSLGLGLVLATAGCAPASFQSASAQPNTYKYELTPKAAHECGTLQLILSQAKEQSDPEWSRRHLAMSMAWYTVIGLLQENPFSDQQAEQLTQQTIDKFPGGDLTVETAADLAKPCEVMSSLHREPYRFAAEAGASEQPELFADNAAFKRQIGGEYPEPPTKELTFGNWFFFAKGNLCFASPLSTEKGKLVLGFINFFDGALRLEWDGLPELNEDNYETEIAKHQAGVSWSSEEDVFLPVLDEGVTYDSFQGTAIFLDKKPIAMLSGEGASMGTKYLFGANIQRPYYNLMPLGRELTIKVLGEETHRFRIDSPAMWNEISECMAQYPFG